MIVRHLNCGTMCPIGGRLMDGRGRGPGRARLVCHCLLIESERDGLVLIDTGLGLRDVRRPRPRLDRAFLTIMRLPLREEETAVRQIERLGYRASDVRHIVLTHLDFDHAGGLEDFPEATVHVLEAEHRAASGPRSGVVARGRYRPMQWTQVRKWEMYRATGEPWFGFGSVRDLRGLPSEILMIPLLGHTWGHAGVAVRGDGWLLHAGDAYFHEDEMNLARPSCPVGLRAYQRLMEVDRGLRLGNQERLRELARTQGTAVRIFSAHDARELARLATAPVRAEGDGPRVKPEPEPAGISVLPPKGHREAGDRARRIVQTGAAGPAPAELNPGSSSTASVAEAPETEERK